MHGNTVPSSEAKNIISLKESTKRLFFSVSWSFSTVWKPKRIDQQSLAKICNWSKAFDIANFLWLCHKLTLHIIDTSSSDRCTACTVMLLFRQPRLQWGRISWRSAHPCYANERLCWSLDVKTIMVTLSRLVTPNTICADPSSRGRSGAQVLILGVALPPAFRRRLCECWAHLTVLLILELHHDSAISRNLALWAQSTFFGPVLYFVKRFTIFLFSFTKAVLY